MMTKPATQSATRPQALVAWMEGLADPKRLRLLRLVERQELGVVELCEILQWPQSTVSRHLKVLADQNWVRSRRQGTTRLYRMILDELDPVARKLWLLAREQTEGWATTHQDELRLRQLLANKQTESQSFFAGAAAEWDRLRAELYGRRFADAAMLSLLPADYVVADLGCGTGALAEALAPCVKQVIAVDNSAAMLKAARRRVGDLANVELRRGDLQAVPIDDGTCDAALLLLVLTYIAQPEAVVKEMTRILKPGGRAVIVDLLPHDREDFRREMGQLHTGFSLVEVERLMRENGLEHMGARALPPEPAAKGPALFLATGTRR